MLASSATRLQAYLRSMEDVEGWFAVGDGLAMAECLLLQVREGIFGDIAEIGVHHGKSFLALANAARSSETIYGIDIFGDQKLNVDKSGQGDLNAFMRNVEKYAPFPSQVKPVAMSSLALAGKERKHLTPLRFLSIDGGHTRALTLNDIEIADRILVPGGICCVDDIIHIDWMGVISGVFAYLERLRFLRGPQLVPFAMLPKKLYMCRPQYRDIRRQQFSDAFRTFTVKQNSEFGRYQIDIYNPRLI